MIICGCNLAKQRRYWCTVHRKSSGNFVHACLISKYVRQTVKPHWKSQARYQTQRTRCTPYQLCSVLHWTERMPIRESRIGKMLCMNFIKPAQSAYVSLVVAVQKMDDSVRLCIDYRELNAISPRDTYSLPQMHECLDLLDEAFISLTLDAIAGYLQVEISDRDKQKTTFLSHHGLYRLFWMSSGLKSAPSTIPRATDKIL